MAAKNFITLNDGVTYSKCHITPKQWKECMTPCVYCAFQVQRECDLSAPYCNHEHVCFINLANVDED